MKWIKANERLPEISDDTLLVVKVTGQAQKQFAYLNKDGYFIVDRLVGEAFAPYRVEWLGKSPSDVSGLVDALKWYADDGNYCYDIQNEAKVQLSSAYQYRGKINEKAVKALAQYSTLTAPAEKIEGSISEGEDKGLGLCLECKKRNATKDYNGHKHYVCDPCYNSLSNYFEEEYK